MSNLIKPHPRNAAGPFYVEHGCCTACDVPMVEAPELFEYDAENHCFVSQQPQTNEEVTRAIGAAWCAELQCIRYRGDDPEILRRFAELDLRLLCDVEPPAHIVPLIRNHATFTAIADSAAQIAESFRRHLTSKVDGLREFKFRAIHSTSSDTWGTRVTRGRTWGW